MEGKANTYMKTAQPTTSDGRKQQTVSGKGF